MRFLLDRLNPRRLAPCRRRRRPNGGRGLAAGSRSRASLRSLGSFSTSGRAGRGGSQGSRLPAVRIEASREVPPRDPTPSILWGRKKDPSFPGRRPSPVPCIATSPSPDRACFQATHFLARRCCGATGSHSTSNRCSARRLVWRFVPDVLRRRQPGVRRWARKPLPAKDFGANAARELG